MTVPYVYIERITKALESIAQSLREIEGSHEALSNAIVDEINEGEK